MRQFQLPRFERLPRTRQSPSQAWMAQLDGDLAVVCPTKWLHQKLGRLGKTARMYCEAIYSSYLHTEMVASLSKLSAVGWCTDFEYGPSCSDVADHAWGTASPYRSEGGWASHAAEIAYVFGQTFTLDGNSCSPNTEERYEAGSSLRLTTVR